MGQPNDPTVAKGPQPPRLADLVARASPFSSEIMGEVARICHTPWNSFYLPAPDGRSLLLNAHTGLPSQWVDLVRQVPIAQGNCPCGQAAFERRVVVSHVTEGNWGKLGPVAKAVGIASAWGIPLVNAQGELIGVYGIFHGTTKEPSAGELASIRRVTSKAMHMMYATHIDYERQAAALLEHVAGVSSAHQWEPPLVEASLARLAEHEFIRGLLIALEVRDVETIAHCHRVTNLALLLAQGMGLPSTVFHEIALGAALHDVGKIGIPDSILHKKGRLTAQEYRKIQEHPIIGLRMVKDFVHHYPTAMAIIRHHHERFDGLGYPDGLAGDQIPLEARLFAVVDAFDVMAHSRPYKQAHSIREARRELLKERGRQFCPRCVEAMLALPEEAVRKAMHLDPEVPP